MSQNVSLPASQSRNSPCNTSDISKIRRQGKNQDRPSDDGGMGRGGRKRKDAPTQHGWRLHWLIMELIDDYGSQAEVSRVTGLPPDHVNNFRNIETSGVKGISAEVVQLLQDRLSLSPMFFFAPWRPGEKQSYKLYSLAQHKAEKKQEAMEAVLLKVQQELADSKARIEALEQAKVTGALPAKPSVVTSVKGKQRPKAG